jgi:presenilin-like A22 family membrane protease
MFRGMAETRTNDQGKTVRIEYPNREKGSSKTVKAVVVLLTLVSAGLMAVVTIGGWEALQGAKLVQIALILIFVLIAFFIARWRSGMLPLIAALAMIALIFAAVSAPEWFARDKDGFTDPALAAEILGMVTLIIIPVQVLLIGFAMSGFRQNWQVEVERRPDDRGDRGDRREPGTGGAVAAPA